MIWTPTYQIYFPFFFGIPKICFEVGNTNLAADLVDRVKYTHVQGHEFGVLLSYHDYALSSLITNTSTSDPYRVEQKLFRFCSQNILWSDYCELVNLESQSSLPPSLQRRPRSDALLNVYTQVLLFFLILDHVPNFSPSFYRDLRLYEILKSDINNRVHHDAVFSPVISASIVTTNLRCRILMISACRHS